MSWKRKIKLTLGITGAFFIAVSCAALLLHMGSGLLLKQEAPRHAAPDSVLAFTLQEAAVLEHRLDLRADADRLLNGLIDWHQSFFAQLCYYIVLDIAAISLILLMTIKLFAMSRELLQPLRHRLLRPARSGRSHPQHEEEPSALGAAAIL